LSARSWQEEDDEMTKANELSRLTVSAAMAAANELCKEDDRIQDWETGATTWFFEDGSALQVSGTFSKALTAEEISQLVPQN